MPRCPKCLHFFRVMDDEDDGQHGCPSCGYGDHADELVCIYCCAVMDPDEYDDSPFCSPRCAINAEVEELENV